MNRLQLLLDAKTLGVIMRDLSAMVNFDAEAARKIMSIRNKILARYGCNSIVACQLRIHILLKEKE